MKKTILILAALAMLTMPAGAVKPLTSFLNSNDYEDEEGDPAGSCDTFVEWTYAPSIRPDGGVVDYEADFAAQYALHVKMMEMECDEQRDLAPFLRGGVTASKCARGAFVCAIAGADQHEEKVDNSPNVGFAGTGGHCQSNWEFGGTCTIETTLGDDTCAFGPWEGCGRNWTDITQESCPYKNSGIHAQATAESYPWTVIASAHDYTCEPAPS